MTDEALSFEGAAREGIRDLVARYNSYGDTGRFEQLLELFADDAVMVLRTKGVDGERRHEGRSEIEEIFTGVRDGVAVELIRHLTATHLIDVVDADHATGRLYFQVLTERGLDHWGRYADRYVRVDGRWRFGERVVTTDAFADFSPFRDRRGS